MKINRKLPKASWVDIPQWFQALYDKHFDPTCRTPEVIAYRAYLLGRETGRDDLLDKARKIMEM